MRRRGETRGRRRVSRFANVGSGDEGGDSVQTVGGSEQVFISEIGRNGGENVAVVRRFGAVVEHVGDSLRDFAALALSDLVGEETVDVYAVPSVSRKELDDA
ncbi:hypothetical protein OPQ81_009883 [Rhizoctonia solani]|nr:hypothetical protein OPQ81_009883 [Rhizoctonia solani]